MREMILNHASLASAARQEVPVYLADMASGMARLVDNGVVPATLRTHRSVCEIPCPDDDSTLFEAYRELGRRGRRDESVFLMRLSAKVPLQSGIDPEVRDRFLGCEATACEARTLSPEDGAPLVLCAIADGIAVGFPSEPVWTVTGSPSPSVSSCRMARSPTRPKRSTSSRGPHTPARSRIVTSGACGAGSRPPPTSGASGRRRSRI